MKKHFLERNLKKIILITFLISFILIFGDLIIISLYHEKATGVVIKIYTTYSAEDTYGTINAKYKYMVNNNLYYKTERKVYEHIVVGDKYEVKYFPLIPSIDKNLIKSFLTFHYEWTLLRKNSWRLKINSVINGEPK